MCRPHTQTSLYNITFDTLPIFYWKSFLFDIFMFESVIGLIRGPMSMTYNEMDNFGLSLSLSCWRLRKIESPNPMCLLNKIGQKPSDILDLQYSLSMHFRSYYNLQPTINYPTLYRSPIIKIDYSVETGKQILWSPSQQLTVLIFFV